MNYSYNIIFTKSCIYKELQFKQKIFTNQILTANSVFGIVLGGQMGITTEYERE